MVAVNTWWVRTGNSVIRITIQFNTPTPTLSYRGWEFYNKVFNIATENGPVIVDLPLNSGKFQQLC